MSKYADKAFWTDTVDRTIASLAQGLVVALGAISAGEAGLLDVDWKTALSMSGGYAVLAFLTSVSFRGNGEKIIATVSHQSDIEELEELEELEDPPEISSGVEDLSEAPIILHVEEEGDFDDEDLFVEAPYEPRHGE